LREGVLHPTRVCDVVHDQHAYEHSQHAAKDNVAVLQKVVEEEHDEFNDANDTIRHTSNENDPHDLDAPFTPEDLMQAGYFSESNEDRDSLLCQEGLHRLDEKTVESYVDNEEEMDDGDCLLPFASDSVEYPSLSEKDDYGTEWTSDEHKAAYSEEIDAVDGDGDGDGDGEKKVDNFISHDHEEVVVPSIPPQPPLETLPPIPADPSSSNTAIITEQSNINENTNSNIDVGPTPSLCQERVNELKEENNPFVPDQIQDYFTPTTSEPDAPLSSAHQSLADESVCDETGQAIVFSDAISSSSASQYNSNERVDNDVEAKGMGCSKAEKNGMTDSMQSLVDGLLNWGGDWDSEDLGLTLPQGMAASLVMEESGGCLELS